MTQNLKGKVFFLHSEKGVMGITPRDDDEETVDLVQRLRDYYGTLGLMEEEYVNAVGAVLMTVLRKPVFTFAYGTRAEESPFFTGNEAFAHELCTYIRSKGGVIRETEFYIPFVNGYEFGIHDIKALQDEIRWITTDAEFEREFCISKKELLLLAPVL